MKPDYLRNLALRFQSDKAGHHEYCGHYQKHFAHLVEQPIKLLELGIGGYDFPERGGAGLKLWSKFFEKGSIYGIDIHDKSGIQLPPRTKIFQGSQADGDFLTKVMQEIGHPDIIIDDASHMNQLTIQSFKHLFPWLKSGGIYVIEDIESSWWNEHGFDGDPSNSWASETTINMCRAAIDAVNSKRNNMHVQNGYETESIHFYENMVVIIKK